MANVLKLKITVLQFSDPTPSISFCIVTAYRKDGREIRGYGFVPKIHYKSKRKNEVVLGTDAYKPEIANVRIDFYSKLLFLETLQGSLDLDVEQFLSDPKEWVDIINEGKKIGAVKLALEVIQSATTQASTTSTLAKIMNLTEDHAPSDPNIPFSWIPSVIVIEIFSYMSLSELWKTSLVCKRWSKLSWTRKQLDMSKYKTGSAWQHVTFTALRKFMGFSSLEKLFGLDCFNIGDRGIQDIVLQCPNLKEFTAYSCVNFDSTNFLHFGKLQHLERLEITGANSVSAQTWIKVVSSLANLSILQLELHGDQRWTDDNIIAFAKGTRNLRSLNITCSSSENGCALFPKEALQAWSNLVTLIWSSFHRKEPAEIFGNLPSTLTHLQIRDLDYRGNLLPIPQEVLDEYIKSHPNVKVEYACHTNTRRKFT